jgi:hypothetical protein
MSRTSKNYEVLKAAAPRAIASSTNASPIEITTSAPHGYSTGQKVTVVGHLVNTNANGTWEVTVTGASTFELNDSAGNGVGGATGTYAPKAAVVQVADFRDITLSFDSDGGGDAALTAKVVGSIQRNPPDFAAPQGPDNQYSYLQMIRLSDSVEVDGGTGVVLAASDINEMFEANVNGVKWLSVVLSGGTEGELTVRAFIVGDV